MNIDLSEIDNVVEALYRAISFVPSASPDYQMFKSLFRSDGSIVPPKEDAGGVIRSMSVQQFLDRLDADLKEADLFAVGATEKEVGRKSLIFKRVAHVASGYHFTIGGAKTPAARGVNFMQLTYDEGRWWILCLSWDRAKGDEELKIHFFENVS